MAINTNYESSKDVPGGALLDTECQGRMGSVTEAGVRTPSVKGQVVNMVDFVDYRVFVATTQLCHCGKKSTIYKIQLNE